jgi:hypothetical protein
LLKLYAIVSSVVPLPPFLRVAYILNSGFHKEGQIGFANKLPPLSSSHYIFFFFVCIDGEVDISCSFATLCHCFGVRQPTDLSSRRTESGGPMVCSGPIS